MNLLITSAQAIGHKIPDLETSYRILWKSGNKKMMSFWKKLIIGNLVCIKTCYSFKPAKPFKWPKVQVPKSWYSEITLIDALGHVIENGSFLENPPSHNPLLLTKMVSTTLWTITLFLTDTNKTLLSHALSFGQMTWTTFWTKSQPFQNGPHMRRDAWSWKIIYDMRRCPE